MMIIPVVCNVVCLVADLFALSRALVTFIPLAAFSLLFVGNIEAGDFIFEGNIFKDS